MAKIREIGEDELEAFVGVLASAMPREETGGIAGLIDWRRQAEAMIWLLAEENDEVVGAGYALTGWHTPPHRGIGAALVVPERRGHGVGDRLRAELERWAAEHGATELEGPVAEDDDGSLAWAAARGYEEAGRNSRDMHGSGDRPEAVFVAIEDGEVLGYAKLAFSDETTERAYHDLTGVKRAHRGRGIAAVLKAAQIAWAKESGYLSLQTSNEVRNAPIRHLNAKHGYVLEPGVVIVRRTLAAT